MQLPLFYFVLSGAAVFSLVSLTVSLDSGMIIARGEAK